MKDYSSLTAADLAIEPRFRAWVFGSADADKAFWENMIRQNPGFGQTVSEARDILRTVHAVYHDDLTDEIQKREIAGLFDKAGSGRVISARRRAWPGFRGYRAAALWLLVVCTAGLYFVHEKRGKNLFGKPATTQDYELDFRKNVSGKPMTVLLDDGSVVVLENKSTLRFFRKNGNRNRTVFLEGQAFFDVARDPAHPFLVYSGSTVTRVLGTSFRIESGSGKVLVAVKTGKVSVAKIENGRMESSVFLHPNEQVSVSEKFEKSIVSDPQRVTNGPDKQELSFDEAAISEVFHALERNYGIRIVFDEARLSACRITTQFADETLRQRLAAICEVTGLHFDIADGEVRIDGSCNELP